MNDKQTDVSIVLEWENVVLSGESRTQATLPELRRQIEDLVARRGLRVEILLVYSTAEFDPSRITETVDYSFPVPRKGYEVRPIPFDAGAYWDKKNAGAGQACGEIVVFFDSDTAPEPGWLAALLAPFEQPHVHAVGGETYPELTGYYSRSMALFWLFPLRSNRSEVATTNVAYGNNAAFRRTTFLKYGYRSLDQFRAGAGDLVARMAADGIVTYMQPNARCGHPPPNGLAHFVRRAACEGHDNVISLRRATGRSPWRQSYWTLRNRMMGDLRSIRSRYRETGLSRPGMLGALAMAVAYSAFIVMGEALTRIDPRIVRRHLRV